MGLAFMTAGINTRVVRRTNALLLYSEDFKYEEVSVYSSKKKAQNFFSLRSFRFRFKFLRENLFIRCFFRSKGCPSFEQRKKGHLNLG